MNDYFSLLRHLRKHCPADLPVIVRRVRMKDDLFGTCGHRDKHYYIRISNRLEEELAMTILMHEWAHALSWTEKECHGPRWGKCYAGVYREFLRWLEKG